MSLHLPTPLVGCDWLQQHLAHPALRVFDCSQLMERKPDGTFGFVPAREAFAAGHIPGSNFVDVATELSDRSSPLPLMMPPAPELAATLRESGVGDDSAVVLYDRGNHAWAARVWWMLRANGFDNAAVLDGGWQRWAADERPQEQALRPYAPAASLTLRLRPGLMVDRQEVLEALDDSATLLLHSLPRPMFTGEVVPYARPGRIKGSENLYCELLVDAESKCFHSPQRLRELLGTTRALTAQRVIAYCGGGIAASNNALALTLLGHNEVAVYDGSLSEWTADPSLPMESGLV
ncbi:MAG: sulfurtransferase [Pseudohongiellaceae bacterium]